jgi:hypothetical protein
MRLILAWLRMLLCLIPIAMSTGGRPPKRQSNRLLNGRLN